MNNAPRNISKETKKISISIGIPAIVIGVLIALKHIGLTNLSYWTIIWFGIKIWLVCIAVAVIVSLLLIFIGALLGSLK